MKWMILYFLVFSFVKANPFILTKEEKETIKKHPEAKIIATRFNRFYKFLNDAKTFDKDKQLIRTNLFVNKIISKYDDATNSWSTPKEFLINGYGDCEDYAITKYFTLLEMGFKEKSLFLAVVQVKGSSSLHMVVIHKTQNNSLLVLDNLSWKVIPLLKRKDLKFEFAFNRQASYSLEKNILIKDKQLRPEVYFFRKLAGELD